ncbi:MAG TPA: serine hydrolase domain-containing protein [Marmoricola sp.]|nr:serine hydrolase domain-containing protein [Marmoricola sp.]
MNHVDEVIDQAHWQRRLHELAARHLVPGAALGILRLGPDGGDDQVTATYGVLSRATGVEATPDTLFQIGSVTKIWTATLAMQLVEEGLLDLDRPVVEVLPEMRLSDPAATAQVTLRHLLTHTSGIDGDAFIDTGRGDDCLHAYVARLDEVAQNFPVGATWSYCNTGFSILGRMIEVVTGQVWDAALKERLVRPLGLTHLATLPEEALLFRTAVGHLAKAGAEPVPTPVWGMERSGGPAGAMMSTSVGDLLAFARLHLVGGRAADGTQVLGEDLVRSMAQHQVEVPGRNGIADSWGLGWMRFDWDGHQLIGHDGNTLGQSAFLRLLPERGLAVGLLTNGGHTRDLYGDLYRELFADLAGVTMPAPFAPPDEPPVVDSSRHTGRYEIAGLVVEVSEQGGCAQLRSTDTSIFADLEPEPVQEFEMHPVTEDVYAIREQGVETWEPVTFFELADGRPFLHLFGRSLPKRS